MHDKRKKWKPHGILDELLSKYERTSKIITTSLKNNHDTIFDNGNLLVSGIFLGAL